MLRLAVTGGIAEGKSTVVSYLADLGLTTISADDVARRVLAEPDMQRRVGERFGLEVPLQRGALREVIASDHAARRDLNRLMHPAILSRLEVSGAQVVEVPLLIESALLRLAPRIWVVTCGPTEQRRRLIERVGEPELAERLIRGQLPSRAKLPFADAIVRTDSPTSIVLTVVRELARANGLA